MLSSLSKLILKASLLLVLLIALSALALHIWFVNNARGVLKQIVAEKSGGKFRIELSQLSFDFFSNTLQVRHADLSSTDSTTQPATYHVKFNKLTLHIGSFWPLLLKKDLILDSIILHDPDIEVKQWRKDTSSIFSNQELSVPQEMGRMYHSMLNVLQAFGIHRILINNARLTLTNEMKPLSSPVSISNIYLDLNKTPNQSVKPGNIDDQSQSIDLRTTNQQIALPGGRHRLSFKNFHLQLFRKRIQLDSCTITAITTDSASSSYKIFFKKLMLTGVDFDAMYKLNLVKADSVYCENPLFDIKIDRQKNAESRKERPDAEKIVRELTGDLDLAFVGVKDAGIRINIKGRSERSLYNSSKDDFEMYGLRIDPDSTMPVYIDRFDMLVRDYQLYNQDSTAVYSFDSIHFNNNKIRLSNFSAVTDAGRKHLHNERDFKIRLFEVTGLDWYELVFNETLKAREAYLYNPVIKFTKTRRSSSGKKRNLFSTLHTFDDFMTLDKITVDNGDLDIKLSDNTSIMLSQVNFSLYSNQLLKSIDKEGLRKAIEYFSFADGTVKINDITARLRNVRYGAKNLVHAGQISLRNTDGNIAAEVDDIFLDNLSVSEDAGRIFIDGLRWKKAKVQLRLPGSAGTEAMKNELSLKNISGNNTDLSVSGKDWSLNTYIRKVNLPELSRVKKLFARGLNITGELLHFTAKNLKLSSGDYRFSDEASSSLSDLRANMFNAQDSISFSTPAITFTPHLNSMLAKDFHLSELTMQAPVFKSVSRPSTLVVREKKDPSFSIRIDRLHIPEPDIYMSHYRNDSSFIIRVPASESSVVRASGIKLDSNGMDMESFTFKTSNASIVNRSGDKTGIEKGKLNLEVSTVHISTKQGKPAWNAVINQFNISNPDKIKFGRKANAFSIQQAGFGNIQLSSAYLSDADQLIQKNLSAWLSNTTGEYIDSVNTFRWYNTAFREGRLSLDSLEFHPTPSREEMLSKINFQKDYITFNTGAVVLTGFKPERYRRDSSVIADTIIVSNPIITIFRDKFPPFAGGVIKPLPVDMIRNMLRPVDVNRVVLKDGMLHYTEKNAKSRAEGTISLTQMQVTLEKLKNRNIKAADSLQITMTALLMDSALISLRIKESYNDSLRGFLMSLRMKPTSLLFLNPVLTPLSNIKIISGTIDSLHLSAVGQEHLAFGQMNMFYKNLRIQLVKDGNPDKTTLSSRLLSFLANTFLIKRNNDGRTGVVYFERMRERSFFNYIIKMTFSGMATSIGVKKNRKYVKAYKRKLKEREKG